MNAAKEPFLAKYGSVLVLAVVLVLMIKLPVAWRGRGPLGDTFGAANDLASGFALAGVVYAIILQRQELALQRQELELARQELQRAATAQETSAEINRLTLEELQAQRFAALDKEKRPVRASIVMLIRSLQTFQNRALTPLFEQPDPETWPHEQELTPYTLPEVIHSLAQIAPDLHYELHHLNSAVLEEAREKLGRMRQLASAGRRDMRPEMQTLESEVKVVIRTAMEKAHAALLLLEESEW